MDIGSLSYEEIELGKTYNYKRTIETESGPKVLDIVIEIIEKHECIITGTGKTEKRFIYCEVDKKCPTYSVPFEENKLFLYYE